MNKGLVEADRARLAGAEPRTLIAAELREFKDQWNLYEKDLAKIVGLPFQTLHSIMVDSDGLVYKKTIDKIREGIANYNPRTCRYRRVHKTEARKAFLMIKNKHGWSWPRVAEATGYPTAKIHQLMSDKTNMQTVSIEIVRNALINYQDYLKRRAETLQRESTHKIA